MFRHLITATALGVALASCLGGGAIFEVRLREPGDYPFVTHAFADATKGAVGVLRALAPGQKPRDPGVAMAH
jgi:hypothetical protein